MTEYSTIKVKLETPVSHNRKSVSEEACGSSCYWQPSYGHKGSPPWNEADGWKKETGSLTTLLNFLTMTLPLDFSDVETSKANYLNQAELIFVPCNRKHLNCKGKIRDFRNLQEDSIYLL